MRYIHLVFWNIVYLALLGWVTTVGAAFDTLSRGLAARTAEGPFFCAQLQSSGGDDDAMIFAFVIFAVPLAVRIIRTGRAFAGYELALVWGCAGVGGVALWLASLECAEVFYTAFAVPDPALASTLIAVPVLCGLGWARYRRRV